MNPERPFPHPREEVDYVVTLVHGTFARRAAWPKEGSRLRHAVCEKLAPASVVFAPFTWSGGNSHRDRVRGGLALRRFLRDRAGEHPWARHLIIAHSHGGNVALYGLRGRNFSGETKGNLAGIICLGTPFIHCTPRDLKRVARTWKRVVRNSGLLLAGFASLALAVCISDGQPLSLAEPCAAFGLLVGVGMWAGSFFLFTRSGRVVNRWARSQNHMLRRLRMPEGLTAPILCIGTARDEARFALIAADSTAEVGGCLTSLISGLISLVSLLLTIATGLGAAGGAWLLKYASVHSNEFEAWNGVGCVAMGVVLLIFCGGAFFVAAITFLASRVGGPMVLSVLLRLTKGSGYGELRKDTNQLLQVTQRPYPLGKLNHSTKFFVTRSPLFSRALRHSSLYNDSQVLDYVTTWILAMAGGQVDGVNPSVSIGFRERP
jgi:hypothetical protein